MSIGTYSCVCSAWIRMRVLACTPLPNSINWASGPTNCAISAMLARRMAHFGARQVVLGQLADRFEQAAALLVVKYLGGMLFWGSASPARTSSESPLGLWKKAVESGPPPTPGAGATAGGSCRGPDSSPARRCVRGSKRSRPASARPRMSGGRWIGRRRIPAIDVWGRVADTSVLAQESRSTMISNARPASPA